MATTPDAVLNPENNAPSVLLVQRLEGAHGWCILQYAQSLVRHRPQVRAGWMEIAGGRALYCGPSAFTFAVGVGMRGAITAAELDEIEDFFFQRGVSSAIDVCPYSDPGLLDRLLARGYRVGTVTSVLCRDLSGDPEAGEEKRPGVEVRWAEDREMDLWVDMMARHFFAGDPGPEVRANIGAMFRVPNSLNTLAFADGKLAGAAGGMLPAAGEVAPLFGSCTLPGFRRRGIHAGLLDWRLRRVREHGCPLVVVTTIPGSDSERNLLRAGFTMAYEKKTYVRPKP